MHGLLSATMLALTTAAEQADLRVVNQQTVKDALFANCTLVTASAE